MLNGDLELKMVNTRAILFGQDDGITDETIPREGNWRLKTHRWHRRLDFPIPIAVEIHRRSNSSDRFER